MACSRCRRARCERLESYTPPWPLPKIFRLTNKGKFSEGIFAEETINTPSMLAVEDAIDSLKWAESIGGLSALRARCESNLAAIAAWVEKTPWVDFLVEDPKIRSCTSVCLKIVADGFDKLPADQQWAAVKKIESLWMPRVSPTTSPVIAMRCRACASGAARRSSAATSRRCCPGSTGLSPKRTKPPPRLSLSCNAFTDEESLLCRES